MLTRQLQNRLFLFFLGLCSVISLAAQKADALPDRKSFYGAMASSKMAVINAQLKVLEKVESPSKGAFIGAMTMKKAGAASNPANKLSLFKSGHKQLEAAIKKDSSDAEFRFLRLMIQENAPGILGYKSDLERDAAYIREKFKQLAKPVQDAVIDYSKKSKILLPKYF